MQRLERQSQDGFRRVVRALRTQDDVRKLEDRIEELEAENAWLREQVTVPAAYHLPLKWRLTKSEGTVLWVIISRPLATKEAIAMTLYGARDEPADPLKIVDVFVCKIRRKLEPFGIHVLTSWGRGYYFEPADRECLRKQLLNGNA